MTLVYFGVLILIGIITSRLIDTIKDYFVADKGLGYWLVSFSSRASGESGWLLLGLTGMGFTLGLHAFWITLGEVLGVMLAWLFLVQRFKIFTDKYDSITIPDYLEDRFKDAQSIIRVTAAFVLSVFVTLYVSGQYVAAGKAFKGFLGMDVTDGIILGMGIVIFYSVAGGFFAVVWSDLIQGLLMLLGLTLVPLVALIQVGGFTELFNSLRALDPVLLTISGSSGPWTIKTIFSILGLISIGWGFLGSPQLFVRFIAIKDNQELVNGSLVAVLFTILTDAGAVISGICGRVLYENVNWMGMVFGRADPEMIYPLLVEDLFPLWISAFFLAVVLAAIMSTADSLLVVASSAIVRDIYQQIINPDASQKWLTRLSRIFTFVLAGLALWFALDQGAPKFAAERRSAPLTRLESASKVPSLSDNNQFTGATARNLQQKWIPAVKQGLTELSNNLRRDKDRIHSLRNDDDAGDQDVSHGNLMDRISAFRSQLASFTTRLNNQRTVPKNQFKSIQEKLASIAKDATSYYPQQLLEVKNTPPVFWFILIGWAGIASAFCPLIILSLYWETVNKWGAVAGIATGFFVVSVWVFLPIDYVLWIPGVGPIISWLGYSISELNHLKDIIYEMVPGFLFSFLAIAVVSLLTDTSSEARDDLRTVRESEITPWD